MQPLALRRVRRTPRGMQDAVDLWEALAQYKDPDKESMLELVLYDGLRWFLGPQAAFQVKHRCGPPATAGSFLAHIYALPRAGSSL